MSIRKIKTIRDKFSVTTTKKMFVSDEDIFNCITVNKTTRLVDWYDKRDSKYVNVYLRLTWIQRSESEIDLSP